MSPEPTSRSRIKAFPMAVVTSGRRLLLVGGCDGKLCRLAHALHFDWASIQLFRTPGTAAPCKDCLVDERVDVSSRAVREEDVKGASLVIESTADREMAERLAGWCRAHHVPLNAMDKLEFCDLFYVSLILRDPLVVAISSGGDSPALSATLRRWVEEHVGVGWSHAAALLAELRQQLPQAEERMELLKSIARDPGFLEHIEQDDVDGMRSKIRDGIDRLRA